MIYAPIIIPTLNRIEHLMRCISSLSGNSWAEHSDLIISVDYPPEPKYEEGYKEVCDFLDSPIIGFKSVNIYKQEHNLGPLRNIDFLLEKAREISDRVIFLEDDIETSPNFIEYMDKGLEIYNSNSDIYAICATGVGHAFSDNNVMLSQNYSAWGVGYWLNKSFNCTEILTRQYLLDIAKKPKKILKLCKEGSSLFFAYQSIVLGKDKLCNGYNDRVPWYDQTIKLYGIFEDKYVIGCCKNKARNWGFDGSGFNCAEHKGYNPMTRSIDENQSFDFVANEPLEFHPLPKIKGAENKVRIIAGLVKIYLHIICGKK